MAEPKRVIKVSVQAFEEIAALLKVAGVQINDGSAITLEKGTFLDPPINYNEVNMRRDCLFEIMKHDGENHIVEKLITDAETMFKYIREGKLPQTSSSPNWK